MKNSKNNSSILGFSFMYLVSVYPMNRTLKWENVETYALTFLSYIFQLIGNMPTLKLVRVLRPLKWLLFKWP